MKSFIRALANCFQRSSRQETASPPRPAEDMPDMFGSSVPGLDMIEAAFDLDNIPGTSRRIGQQAQVFRIPNGPLVTANMRNGILTGCGHHVFSLAPLVTSGETQPGIGGFCNDCAIEAEALLKQNVIGIPQAEEMSLYCSACASHCDGCHRQNLCSRHTQLFPMPDGITLTLCPMCYQDIRKSEFFRKVVSVALLPFIDHRRLR